jgi:hypothetical protein
MASTDRPLSLAHLEAQGRKILDEVEVHMRAGTALDSVAGPLPTASLARLGSVLSFHLPVLESPMPQRVGRLCDVLAFASDPALRRLAVVWAEELEQHGGRLVTSLVAPAVHPEDWPHRVLQGSNPRLTRARSILGLDDGTTCWLLDLVTQAPLARLPGRLVGIDAQGATVLTQERGALSCHEIGEQGTRERWRVASGPKAITHAVLEEERVITLAQGQLQVLDAASGEQVAHDTRDGMRGLLETPNGALLITERALHTIAPDGTIQSVFSLASALAAVVAHDEGIFVTEYWERVIALDPLTFTERWSSKVRAQYAGLAITNDGRRLAVGSAKSTEPLASLFDAETGTQRVDVTSRGYASQLAFDAAGARLFVNGSVFETESGLRIGVLPGRGGPAHGVQVSRDGEHLVALSPGGVCLFDARPEIERAPLVEARPAWRALLFGDEVLTDGSEQGFERWSLEGTFLGAHPEQLLGVVGDALLVTLGGHVALWGGRASDVRFTAEGRAWVPEGLGGFVLERAPGRFEIRDARGALRLEGTGRVSRALGEGRWLAVEHEGTTRILDGATGVSLVSLGTGVRLIASDGATGFACVRQEGRARFLDLHSLGEGPSGGRLWSIAMPDAPMSPPMHESLELSTEHVVYARTDLDPGTEEAVLDRSTFDRATGKLLEHTESTEAAGPGMTQSKLGTLEARVVGGKTTVLDRGVTIATLPVPLTLAGPVDRPLLIGPRGPSIYRATR